MPSTSATAPTRFWFLAVIVSALVTLWIVFVGEGIDAYYRTRLVDMVNGTAYRPFVFRALVPTLARLGVAIVPAANLLVVVALVMWVSLVGFVIGLRNLSRAMFVASNSVHATIALTAVAALPLTFGPFSRQIYDFTTLCLFTWCLILIARGQWLAYLAIFLLACLNKESAVLLVLVSAVDLLWANARPSKGAAAALVAGQIAIAAIVRAGLLYAFRDNPGDTVEIHFYDHNQYVLLHPMEMSKRLWLLVVVGAAGVWAWNEKPAFLRRTLLVMAPALVVMGATVGVIDEIRAYYEIYPVIALLAAHTICGVMSIDIRAASGDLARVSVA